MNISNNYYQVFLFLKCSVKKISSTTPSFVIVFLWLCSGCHFSLFTSWSTNSCHIWHLRLEIILIIFIAQSLPWLLLLLLITTSIILLLILLAVSTTVHHPLGFLFSVQHHQLLTELLIWHT